MERVLPLSGPLPLGEGAAPHQPRLAMRSPFGSFSLREKVAEGRMFFTTAVF